MILLKLKLKVMVIQLNKSMGPGGRCCYTCNACIEKENDEKKVLAYVCMAHPEAKIKAAYEWCREWQPHPIRQMYPS